MRTELTIENNFSFLLLLGCKFDCNKDGTSGGICNKDNGLCICKVGWYGNACDQGKTDSYLKLIVF